MNASMNDTHNLAWKLVYVLRGWPFVPVEDIRIRKKIIRSGPHQFNLRIQFAQLFSGKPRTEENQDGVSHEEFLKIFQKFGGFTSGIGIHYGGSTIVDVTRQECAKNVVVGQRMPPQMLLRAADSRPVQLQDMLPSDTLFKTIVFGGDGELLDKVAPQLEALFNRYRERVDMMSILSSSAPAGLHSWICPLFSDPIGPSACSSVARDI
ncbi:unnamed protein product [Mycena citricolor]|uniref:Phenol hydroxylase-like C-terminal dimerisation domain-containing protein n=1 Tax=Mycena citricolor TaxID=2018698 RepID=A0AAD2H0D6_9AGAR|nr:unnamed protein product [Mycena citricolor]